MLATNKVCQQGVLQKTFKTLEVCKARCAAVAACAYLAWDQSSKKECVHYSDETCQITGLSANSGENQLFKKFGSMQGQGQGTTSTPTHARTTRSVHGASHVYTHTPTHIRPYAQTHSPIYLRTYTHTRACNHTRAHTPI